MQQNNKHRLCGDRDKMINPIIRECSIFALKEFKRRHDWFGKMIYWELNKKFKLGLTNKWYIYNVEYVLDSEMRKDFMDFEIKADKLILARRPDLELVKTNCRRVHFAAPADHRVKLIESENSDKYLNYGRELKKQTTIEHESEGDTNCTWCTWNNLQRIGKGTESYGINRMIEDYLDCTIVKIGQNTEKSWGDLLSPKLKRNTSANADRKKNS